MSGKSKNVDLEPLENGPGNPEVTKPDASANLAPGATELESSTEKSSAKSKNANDETESDVSKTKAKAPTEKKAAAAKDQKDEKLSYVDATAAIEKGKKLARKKWKGQHVEKTGDKLYLVQGDRKDFYKASIEDSSAGDWYIL